MIRLIRKLKSRMRNESGFSLIEVIISLVILTIILLSIFALIIQAMKTREVSENIIDATYIAQTEMENAFAVSNSSNFDERITSIQNQLNYPPPISTNGALIFRKTKIIENNEVIIQLELRNHSSLPNLTPIIIKVFEVRNSEEKLTAQMENILAWR